MIKTTALALFLLTTASFADVQAPVSISEGGVLASVGDHVVVLSLGAVGATQFKDGESGKIDLNLDAT